MARRRDKGRAVNGIILLDKPQGITSNKVLQKVKQLFGANKAGHTGSLDPLATGMLPLCFGEGTKVSAFLLDANKEYHLIAKLGENTTTGDSEGEVLDTFSTAELTLERVREVVESYLGEIDQVPPMFSAIKHEGQPLYKLARQGIIVERKSRRITIYDLELVSFIDDRLELKVRCSKGTYVRTLVEDIGRDLKCGGHVVMLRRTAVTPYEEMPMVTLETLQQTAEQGGFAALDQCLHAVDTALVAWPSVSLNDDMAYYLKMGQAVQVSNAPTQGLLRLYQNGEQFIGMGCVDEDGKVAPKRLIVV
ncbi:MAG: tRNA pseudouridine(55) synthase TruB [Gammaproteobacteria bacterium]|nr:tRNA pseudouridine(55) synthase TruB [Gammaproteobacteria bacterium]